AGDGPASLTNTLTPIPSSGTTATDAIADLQALVTAYLAGGGNLSTAVVVLSSANAVKLRLSGLESFRELTREGGFVAGVPAVASDSVGDVLVLIDVANTL